MSYIINPKTDRKIKFGGHTYSNLIKEGYTHNKRTGSLVSPSKQEDIYRIRERDVKKKSKQDVFCYPINIKASREWRLFERIGTESAFGNIWSACENSNCNYVIKHQKYRRDKTDPSLNIDKDFIENEIKLQKECSSIGLCVNIIDHWYCKDGGSFVMPSLSMTAKKLFITYTSDNVRWTIFSIIMGMIAKLHYNGIYHGDVHLENIMVIDKKLTTRELNIVEKNETLLYTYSKYKFYFIDMGFSGFLTDDNIKEKTLTDYRRLRDAFKWLRNDTKDYFFVNIIDFMNNYINKLK